MTETDRISFSYQEVVELLVKQKGIHEGIWAISFRFDLGAGNVAKQGEANSFIPAAIVPITEIGIQRVDELSNLTVDASKVNPQSNKKKK